MPQWTKEQEEAIYESGKNILVAAAAGSGKTAVLVERIIQKLLHADKPIDIDTLLVVTFTNAAAQEMRNRIGEALEQALEENPTSQHLKKQLALLQHASISTLHSFCMELARKYAYQIDIDPKFRIADSLETDLIKQEVLEELFEKWYGEESEEEREAFYSVVERFSNDRNDVEVESLLLKLYEFSIQHPNPNQWLARLAEVYHVDENTPEEQLDWLINLKKEISMQFDLIEGQITKAINIARESDGPIQYLEALEADWNMLVQARETMAQSWEETRTFFHGAKFKTLSRKKTECSEDKKEEVKAIREKVKKRWNKIKEENFTRSLTQQLQDMSKMYPIILHLVKMIKAFQQDYQAAKKERGVVDFTDLEHYALEILLEDRESLQPSRVAIELQQRFSEVMVDEYQDTNLVQETILLSVSNQVNEGNMFMVGDVKQSIYRFRHADPSLFINKYNQFSYADNPGYRIDLAKNFRSRNEVLQAANYIFRQLFDEEAGDIEYDEHAELKYGNKMYDEAITNDLEVELLLLDREMQEEEREEYTDDELESMEDLEKAQIEARAYAEKIKQWIGSQENESAMVMDKHTGRLRPANYRDMVILLRSMKWAPTIMEEFKRQGIPVYAELSTGYFAAIEIQVMISLLKAIDNPRQDIALASVLKSPIVGINENELAEIRLAKKGAPFYDALKEYMKSHHHETVEAFLKNLENWRQEARQGELSSLIWRIYQETGYYDFVGGIPGGRQRQANLRALFDRAKSYEATSFRGLFRFLRFIERMEEKGEDLGAAKALGEEEDVVRLITIHKSKGLEFPFVIVGGLDNQFNQQDIRQKYLLHKEYGFATKYIDPVTRIIYPTLFYQAVKKETQREMIAEEMRVLYVALTRAKERLVLVGNIGSFEKKKKRWEDIVQHDEWVLPSYYRLESVSYLDWIGAALARHQHGELLRDGEHLTIRRDIAEDASVWKVQRVQSNKFQKIEEENRQTQEILKKAIEEWQPIPLEDSEKKLDAERRLTYQYDYEDAIFYRAKQTVTELKRQFEMKDVYSDQQMIEAFRTPIQKRPRFIQEEANLTKAEIGTAMHTVMQHLPFDRQWNIEGLQEFVASLQIKEILTEQEADAIDLQSIEQFFETEIAQRFMTATQIEKEIPFSITLPATEVYPNWSDKEEERIFLQGVIDCVMKTEDGIVLVDYKTDQINETINEQTKAKLLERYHIQINLYARALESIWKEPVVEKYLYFFDKGLLIEG